MPSHAKKREGLELLYAPRLSEEESYGCLVLFFLEGGIQPPEAISSAIRAEVGRLAALGDFSGKAGQTHVLPAPSGGIARLLCVGMGKAEKIQRETLLRAAGAAGKELVAMDLEKAIVWLPEGLSPELSGALGEIFAEGIVLGSYKFEVYKQVPEQQPPRKKLARVTLVDAAAQTSAASMKTGFIRGSAVTLARLLGNQPPNVMTPTQLAKEAGEIAQRRGLELKVLEQKDLEKLGMGMFMGVAKGSRQPPKLMMLHYKARGAKKTLAFVGKGITFDSGGISLKPGASMDEMKFDMCGAAAVLGAMDGIGALKPKVNVVGVIPACENLPDGNSLKPGDILKAFSGTFVEILNTDAEGRLILGDALAYAIKKFKPDAVVDLATLTGACVVALGHYASGAVTNNEELLEKVVFAGKASGDIVWPLPNFPEYEEGLKGKYAELQNIGPREGGAITAGLFLKHFVGEVPWVHLDIAGTAWGVKNISYIPDPGATGVGVRLLIDLAIGWK